MKQHIQFYKGDHEAIGTYSILPLDGRLGIASACDRAREQAHSLRKVQPNYSGFRVMRGNIANARPITKLIKL